MEEHLLKSVERFPPKIDEFYDDFLPLFRTPI